MTVLASVSTARVRRPRSTEPSSQRMPHHLRVQTAGDNWRGDFGPKSLPLFYTAVRAVPKTLTVDDELARRRFTLSFGRVGCEGSEAEYSSAGESRSRGNTWPLLDVFLTRGEVYWWKLVPDAREQVCLGLRPDPAPAAVAEGRLWLLSSEQKDRFDACKTAMSGVSDPDFRAFGFALLIAEIGLYHDSLRLVDDRSLRLASRARVEMAHTVQAIIYGRMLRHLSEDPLAANSPASFASWAANRQSFHLKQAALRSGGPRPRGRQGRGVSGDPNRDARELAGNHSI